MKLGYLAIAAVASLAMVSCGSKQKAEDTVNVVEVTESINTTEVIEDTVGQAADQAAAQAAQQQAAPASDTL